MKKELLTCLPFAHRGLFANAAGVPENSLAAFRAAKAAGFGMEMDVALSGDGEVVVFHDDRCGRLCGVDVALKETPWKIMQNFRLLGTSERVPLLGEVLQEIAGSVPLMIELKSFDSEAGFHCNGELENKVMQALSAYAGDFALKSFNPFTVRHLKNGEGLRAPVGFLACNYTRDGDFPFLSAAEAEEHANLESREASLADFISYNIHDLEARHRQTVGASKPILVWTVRTAADYRKAADLADNIVFEWRGVAPERFKQ